MDYAAKFAVEAQRGYNLLDYTTEFCHLTVSTPFDDETLKSLFLMGPTTIIQ